MDNKTITDEIYRLMGQIADRTERMSTYKGKVPAIELDLVMEDTRRLYDYFRLMHVRSGTDYAPHREETNGTAPVGSIPTEVEAETDRKDNFSHEVSYQITPTEEEPAEISDEAVPGISKGSDEAVPGISKGKDKIVPEQNDPAVSDEEPEDGKEQPVAGLDTVSAVTATTGVKEVVPAPSSDDHDHHVTILAEKLGRRSDKKSINDLIAAKRSDVSISSRMQHNPIRDLKSAIGINEKFIYVYELFGGNSQAYSKAIERLNGAKSRDEAIGLMESMREQYHWDIENMAFQKLVDMVARRYS